MTTDRWTELNRMDEPDLSPEEYALGWHWCDSWDGLLVGPEMMEAEACECEHEPEIKKIYQDAKPIRDKERAEMDQWMSEHGFAEEL